MSTRLIFVVALACGWFLQMQPAAACSFAPPDWEFQTRDGLLGAPGLPLFIEAFSYGFPDGGYPELEAEVTVFDVDGNEVAGASTIEVNAGDGLIRWRPEDPFEISETFTVVIDSTSDEEPTEATLEIVEFEAPKFPARSPVAREVEQVRTYECCQVEDGLNEFCIKDSCGDYRWDEKCRDCRVIEFEYPVRLYLNGSDRPTIQPEPVGETFRKYYELRLLEVVGDELVEVYTGAPQGGLLLDELAGERCFREEYVPRHDSLESLLAPEFCVSPSDLETVERISPNRTFEAEHCLVGSRIVGNFVDGFEESSNVDSGGKEKSEGGCSTAGVPTHGDVSILLLFLGLAIGRRIGIRGGM